MRTYNNILITGATSGFGLETAKLLAEQGYTIIATGRRKEKLEELANISPNIFSFELDVCNKNSISDLKIELERRNLIPDVIVNNAGLALGRDPFDQCETDDWEKMIDTNIKGLLFVTREFSPYLRAKDSGYIINIGSIAGNYSYFGGNVYCGTKAFVNHFSQCMRTDLRGSKVKVTSIEPGAAKTEFSDVRFKGNKEAAEDVYRGFQPLVGADIANIISYLLSLPEHVNINFMELMPVMQTPNGFEISRK